MGKSVLIVGCGVFGLSTALDMAKQGYEILAIDAHEPPSPWSAGCDYNKILRPEYSDIMYTKMAYEAIEQWRHDPKFKGIYNECGRVMITPSHSPGRRAFEKKGLDNMHSLGQGFNVKTYNGGEKLAEDFKCLEFNSIPDTEMSYYNPECGLAHAANGLVAVYKEARDSGVKFIFGPGGLATGVRKDGGKTYIQTENGTELTADQIVICSGANTPSILPMNNQQTATGCFVTFVQLTEKEREFYKDLPIVFDAEMGFFFPPDPATGLFKLVLPGNGGKRITSDPHDSSVKTSLPRYHDDHPEDTMPTWGIRCAKELMGRYVPDLAYHKLFGSKVCWIAITQDSHFIIDLVPNYSNLYVATGDSGHGFKFLPNIGKYIRARLDGTLDEEKKNAWKWRSVGGVDASDADWRVGEDSPDFTKIDWVVEKV